MIPSLLNYTGSKHNLIEIIDNHIPDNTNTLYDLFCGGLSVTINSKINNIVANDIIEPLIGFYKNIQNNPYDVLLDNVLHHKIDKENQNEFIEKRKVFNQTKDPYLFFALTLSCTNNMMRFNKKYEFNQTFGKRTINDKTINKLKEYHNVIHKKNIVFDSFDYLKFLDLYDPTSNDLVYIDPPYLITEAGYNQYWSINHENKLYDFIDTLNEKNIKFIMSNVAFHKNVENPFLDRLKKYNIIDVVYNYNKVAKNKVNDTKEILIKNF
jgi:DNA adenine methylase Dam